MPYEDWDQLIQERSVWRKDSVKQLDQKENLFVANYPNLLNFNPQEIVDLQATKQKEFNSSLEGLRKFDSELVLPVLHYDFLPKKPIIEGRAYLLQSDAASFANLRDIYDYFLHYVSEGATLNAESHGFTNAHATSSINHISGQCPTCVQIVEAHCSKNAIAATNRKMALSALPNLAGLIHLQGISHCQIKEAYKQFKIINLLLENLLFCTLQHSGLNSKTNQSELERLESREKIIALYKFDILKIRNFDLTLFQLLVDSVDIAKQIVFLNLLKHQLLDIEQMRKNYREYATSMAQVLLLIGIGSDKHEYSHVPEIFRYKDMHLYLPEDARKHMQEHDDLYEHALYAGISDKLRIILFNYRQKYKKTNLMH